MERVQKKKILLGKESHLLFARASKIVAELAQERGVHETKSLTRKTLNM